MGLPDFPRVKTMSRAFVKELDGDQVPDDLPDLPQSPHSNYTTPGGLADLKRRLAEALATKKALGSKPDQLASKLSLAEISRQIRFLQGRIERAIVTDPHAQPHDKVCFGATVQVEDEAGQDNTVTIVGEDEADADSGKVSWVSPLATALLGTRVGDVVVWKRPAGDLELEVLNIRYS